MLIMWSACLAQKSLLKICRPGTDVKSPDCIPATDRRASRIEDGCNLHVSCEHDGVDILLSEHFLERSLLCFLSASCVVQRQPSKRHPELLCHVLKIRVVADDHRDFT